MDLFVYGSLKKGFSNHHFLRGAIFRGPAVTRQEARLIDCGGFPGIVPAEPGTGYRIQGELWRILPESLPAIDWLEDIGTGLYVRTAWPVLLRVKGREEEITAAIYLYEGATSGRTEVGPVWNKGRDLLEPSALPDGRPFPEDQQ